MNEIAAPDRLRAHLEQRLQALSDEVRHYPTPIARCDEQLTALLETRADVARLLAMPTEGDFGAELARYAERWDDSEARHLLGWGDRRAGSIQASDFS